MLNRDNPSFNSDMLFKLFNAYEDYLVPGRESLAQKQYANAIAHFTQAILLCDYIPEAYVLRAEAYQKMDNPGDTLLALADLQMVLTLIPEHTSALLKCAAITGQLAKIPEKKTTPKQLKKLQAESNKYAELNLKYKAQYAVAIKQQNAFKKKYDTCLQDNYLQLGLNITIVDGVHIHNFQAEQVRTTKPALAFFLYRAAEKAFHHDIYSCCRIVSLFLDQGQFLSAQKANDAVYDKYQPPLSYLYKGLFALELEQYNTALQHFSYCLNNIHPEQFPMLEPYREKILDTYLNHQSNEVDDLEVHQLTASLKEEPGNALLYMQRAMARICVTEEDLYGRLDYSFAIWLGSAEKLDIQMIFQRALINLSIGNLIMAQRDMDLVNKYLPVAKELEAGSNHDLEFAQSAMNILEQKLLLRTPEDITSQYLDLAMGYKEYGYLKSCVDKLMDLCAFSEAQSFIVTMQPLATDPEKTLELNEYQSYANFLKKMLDRYSQHGLHIESRGKSVEAEATQFSFKDLYEGHKLFNEKKYEQALVLFEKAIAQCSHDYIGMGFCGVTHSRLQQYDKAVEILEQCLQEVDDYELWLELGKIYHLQGLQDKAKTYLKNALLKDFENSTIDLKYLLFVMGVDPNNIGQASVTDLTKFKNLCNNTKLKPSKVSAILIQLDEIIMKFPTEPEFFAFRGDFHFALQHWEKARLDYALAMMMVKHNVRQHKLFLAKFATDPTQAVKTLDNYSNSFAIKKFKACLEYDHIFASRTIIECTIPVDDDKAIIDRARQLAVLAENANEYHKSQTYLSIAIRILEAQKESLNEDLSIARLTVGYEQAKLASLQNNVQHLEEASIALSGKMHKLDQLITSETNKQISEQLLKEDEEKKLQSHEAIDIPEYFLAYRNLLIEQRFEEAIALHPLLPDAYFALAKMDAYKAKQPEFKNLSVDLQKSALKNYKKAFELNPGDYELLIQCADLSDELGEAEQATLFRAKAEPLMKEEAEFIDDAFKFHVDHPTLDAEANAIFISIDAAKANFQSSKFDIRIQLDQALYSYEKTAIRFKNNVISRIHIAEVLVNDSQKYGEYLAQHASTREMTLFALALSHIILHMDDMSIHNSFFEDAKLILLDCVVNARAEDYIKLTFFKITILQILNNTPNSKAATQLEIEAGSGLVEESCRYAKEKNFSEAAKSLLAALQLIPEDYTCYMFLGDCCSALQQFPNANMNYATALWLASAENEKDIPLLTSLNNKRAFVNFCLGNRKDAYRNIDLAVTNITNTTMPFSELCNFYFEHGFKLLQASKPVESQEYWCLLGNLTQDSAFFFDCAERLFTHKFYSDALYFYIDALLFWEESTAPSQSLYTKYEEKFEYLVRYNILTESSFNPSSITKTRLLGDFPKAAAIMEGLYKQALIIQSHSQLAPREEQWVIQATAAYDKNNYTFAILYYDKLVDHSQEGVKYLPYRGLAHFYNGDADLAYNDFDKTVKLSKNDPRALFLRSVMDYERGKKELARTNLRVAIVMMREDDYNFLLTFRVDTHAILYVNDIPRPSKKNLGLNSVETLEKINKHLKNKNYDLALNLIHRYLNNDDASSHKVYALLAETLVGLKKWAGALMAISSAYMLAPLGLQKQYMDQKIELFPISDYAEYLKEAEAKEQLIETKVVSTTRKPKQIFANTAVKKSRRSNHNFKHQPDEEEVVMSKNNSPAGSKDEEGDKRAESPSAVVEIIGENKSQEEPRSPASTQSDELALAPVRGTSPQPISQEEKILSAPSSPVSEHSPAVPVLQSIDPVTELLDEMVSTVDRFSSTTDSPLQDCVPDSIVLSEQVQKIFAAMDQYEDDQGKPFVSYLVGGEVLNAIYSTIKNNMLIPGRASVPLHVFSLFKNYLPQYTYTALYPNTCLHFVTGLPLGALDDLIATSFPGSHQPYTTSAAKRIINLENQPNIVIVFESIENLSQLNQAFNLPYADHKGVLQNLNKVLIVNRELALNAETYAADPVNLLRAMYWSTAYQLTIKEHSLLLGNANKFAQYVANANLEIQKKACDEINFYLSLLFSEGHVITNYKKLIGDDKLTAHNLFIDLFSPTNSYVFKDNEFLLSKIISLNYYPRPYLKIFYAYFVVAIAQTSLGPNAYSSIALSLKTCSDIINSAPLFKHALPVNEIEREDFLRPYIKEWLNDNRRAQAAILPEPVATRLRR
jgi:Flp pilus assembly protein TadD